MSILLRSNKAIAKTNEALKSGEKCYAAFSNLNKTELTNRFEVEVSNAKKHDLESLPTAIKLSDGYFIDNRNS